MATIMRVGGGGASLNVLTVAVESGAVVTARSGTKVVTATSVDGIAVLKLQAGTWALVATKDGQTAEDSIIILDEYPVDVSFGLPLSSLAEGALVKLNENGTGVNFYLSKHDYESGLNGAGRSLVVRKDCYQTGAWNSSSGNTYASCTMDSWFNSTYKALLDSAVQELIGTTKFYYTVGGGSTSKTTLSRSIFALSLYELGKTQSQANAEGSTLPIASTLVTAYLNGNAVNQWTRTAYKSGSNHAYWVNGSSYNGTYNCQNAYGYRPIFTLPSDAMVSETPNADGSYTLIA